MLKILLYVTIGFVSGALGAMGVGGGSVSILLMSWLLGYAQQEAQLVNMLIFIIPAVTACIKYKKSGFVKNKTVLTLILSGLPAAALTAWLGSKTNSDLLSKLFGAFLVAVGIWEAVSMLKADKKSNQH